MAEKLVTFEGKTHAFPDDFTDAEISAALGAIPSANADASPKAKTWTAMAMAGASKAVSPAAKLLEEFGTSPTAAKTVGKIANVGTTLAGIGHGVATGNAPEVIMAPIAGWNAGKGGYFLGKGAQAVARPVASALEKVAPYAEGAGMVLSGAQGALDLAQMAEPERKDIGFLGIGKGADVKNDQAALARVVAASPSLGDAVVNLQKLGLSQGDAVRTVLNLKAKAMR